MHVIFTNSRLNFLEFVFLKSASFPTIFCFLREGNVVCYQTAPAQSAHHEMCTPLDASSLEKGMLSLLFLVVNTLGDFWLSPKIYVAFILSRVVLLSS